MVKKHKKQSAMYIIITITWLQTNINCRKSSSFSGIYPYVSCGGLCHHGWTSVLDFMNNFKLANSVLDRPAEGWGRRWSKCECCLPRSGGSVLQQQQNRCLLWRCLNTTDATTKSTTDKPLEQAEDRMYSPSFHGSGTWQPNQPPACPLPPLLSNTTLTLRSITSHATAHRSSIYHEQ